MLRHFVQNRCFQLPCCFLRCIQVRTYSESHFNSTEKRDTLHKNVYRLVHYLNKPEKAIQYLYNHYNPNESLCPKTLVALMRAYSKLNKFDEMYALFKEAKTRYKCDQEESLCIAFIEELIHHNKLDEARRVLQEMKKLSVPHEILFGKLIKGFVDAKRIEEAKDLLEEMKRDFFIPNLIIYTTIIHGLTRANRIDEALKMAVEMKREYNLEPNVKTLTPLVTGYISQKKVEVAKVLLNLMRKSNKQKPDYQFYVQSISTACKGNSSEQLEFAELLLQCMIADGHQVNIQIINMIMNTYTKLPNMEKVVQLFSLIDKYNIQPDAYTITICLNSLLKRDEIEKALLFKEKLKENYPNKIDVTTFNCFIHFYEEKKQISEIYKIFEEMKSLGIEPDECSYSGLLKGLSRIGNLDAMEQEFQKIPKKGIKSKELLYQIVITSFCRFTKMKKAMHYYKMMIGENIIPNKVINDQILNGYLKSGNKKDARKFEEIYLSK